MDHEQYVVLTKWGIKWLRFACDYALKGGKAERFAKDVLKTFDGVEEEPSAYVDTHVTTIEQRVEDHTSLTTSRREVKHVRKVLKKGLRSAFAASVAKVAYNKFGERKMTEANLLVTRKWIAKYLDEEKYKDLRTCDKNLAIDRALFLSFLPTRDFQAMKIATTTNAWKDRADAEGVFGKIFRLVSSPLGLDILP